MHQTDLFVGVNMTHGIDMPRAPLLGLHDWPFPGLTPLESAQSGMAQSAEYAHVVALTILRRGGFCVPGEVLASIPQDWRAAAGPFAHASLTDWQAKPYGIRVEYVSHDGAGFHFQYHVEDAV